MLVTVVTLVLLLVATITDVAWRTIYNWNTYSGLLLALAIHGAGSLWGEPADPANAWTRAIGWIGLGECLLGLLACGLVMLTCYVFFRIGGGDVKLLTMTGALLGLMPGIEVLLWTFVLGGMLGTWLLVWRVGAWNMVRLVARHLLVSLRLAPWPALSPAERQSLQPALFLAPMALAATLIVRFQAVEHVERWWQGG